MAANRRKYSEEELLCMDRKADTAVTTMTLAGVGMGFAPVLLDIAALMVAMGTGVVAIGKCYDMKMNKDDAADLIRQFFKAAGLTFSMVFAGQKISTSVLKSNPVTYLPTMIADAVLCGSVAFAVGGTSKRYFRRLAAGKKVSESEMKAWMKEGKKAGKELATQYAQEKAKEFKQN